MPLDPDPGLTFAMLGHTAWVHRKRHVGPGNLDSIFALGMKEPARGRPSDLKKPERGEP
jgi:hypothetical protein